jgi:osmotically-inducible protein OsmY
MSTTGRRAPAYTTVVAFPYDAPKPTQLQTDLQQIISASSALTSKDIKVKVAGQAVVLEGSVANDRERRLAEGLLRLTPGVRQLRNNLVVKESLTTSKPGP